MIAFAGDVKLTDFGIAKARGFLQDNEGEVVAGKADYMSPEQADFQITDKRSDIFSTGVVLAQSPARLQYFQGRQRRRIARPHHDHAAARISASSIRASTPASTKFSIAPWRATCPTLRHAPTNCSTIWSITFITRATARPTRRSASSFATFRPDAAPSRRTKGTPPSWNVRPASRVHDGRPTRNPLEDAKPDQPAPRHAGLIQTRCSPDPAETLDPHGRRIADAARQGAQIICTQELFRSQYFCQTENHDYFKLAEPIPGPSTKALQQVGPETQSGHHRLAV